MFRCYRDNENLKKHFGHMDTLSTPSFRNFSLILSKVELLRTVKPVGTKVDF